jgi:hypothetical protein
MKANIMTAPVPSTATANGEKANGGLHLIYGRKLAALLKAGTASDANMARLAHELQTGVVAITGLTARQARQMTGASRAGLAAERRAHQPVKGRRVLYRSNPSDADVDKVVARVGADRIMRALDRYTQPSLLAAE